MLHYLIEVVQFCGLFLKKKLLLFNYSCPHFSCSTVPCHAHPPHLPFTNPET